ncbi:mariner Mos1 transposase [Nephila pilipes]|uniref:Mariner Mos1 transposase n=1 Tax=Nephila pilipes TaxID=299642 RepID=A0A8X6QVK0_NEPPI|nr:mariner Mos1 transposase [Nephila pilipes]
MKEELSKRRYHSGEEVKAATREWLWSFGRDFFAEGIEKLVPHLDKCLNNGSSYVENLAITIATEPHSPEELRLRLQGHGTKYVTPGGRFRENSGFRQTTADFTPR